MRAAGRTVAYVAERDRLTYDPWKKSFVNAMAKRLDEEVGPRWIGWHLGDVKAVPGAALFARFTESETGRQVLSGVMLLGAAITADMLRKVPVSALENSTNLTRTDKQLKTELAKLPPLARGNLAPEEFSKLVAEHYKVWARAVPHPAAAMAAQAEVKPPTMHTWIREARLRGFLPPAKRGKAR